VAAGANGAQASQGRPSSASASLDRLVGLNLRGKSFRYNINGYVSAPDTSQASMVGNGEVDTLSKSVRVSGTFGIPPSGYGLSSASTPSGQSAPFPGRSATFQLIQTLGAEYVGGRLFASLVPAGKMWASLDYAGLSKPAAASANATPNLEDNIYPMLQILRLPGTGVSVSRSSSGNLDGAKLSYYKVSIRPAELVERIDSSSLSQSDKFRITSVLGWSTITCYIGFDATGRLRQVQDLASTVVDGTTLKLNMVENMATWTRPLRIAAPPASEVYDQTHNVNSGAAQIDAGHFQTV
jgi:hypothetical protein